MPFLIAAGPDLVDRWVGDSWTRMRVPSGIVVAQGEGTPPSPTALSEGEVVAATSASGRVRVAITSDAIVVSRDGQPVCRGPRTWLPSSWDAPLVLAVGPTHVAALAAGRHYGVTLYDVDTCIWSGVTQDALWAWQGPVYTVPDGGQLMPDSLTWLPDGRLVVSSAGQLTTWRNLGEVPWGRDARQVLDVLPTEFGPALLVRGALIEPDKTVVELGGQVAVVGESLVQISDRGLTWLDGAGRRIDEAPLGSISTLEAADRVSGGLRVSGGGVVVTLGAAESGQGAFGGVHGSHDDHPDLPDRTAAPPLHGAVVPSTGGGRRVLVEVPTGVEVQGDGASWGAILPVHPSVAGVSADGATSAASTPLRPIAAGMRPATRSAARRVVGVIR